MTNPDQEYHRFLARMWGSGYESELDIILEDKAALMRRIRLGALREEEYWWALKRSDIRQEFTRTIAGKLGMPFLRAFIWCVLKLRRKI